MSKIRLANLCVVLGLALFLSANVRAAITVDGTRDAEYGSALAVQTCGTGFGAGANGSSLANAYAINDGTNLYLFIGGNIENNYNKFLIFIDSKTGGQNTLNFTAGPDGTSSLTNLKFDGSFEADYFIVFRWGGGSGNAYADLATLGASGSAVSASAIVSGGILSQGVSWAAINTASNGPTSSDPGDSANVTTGMEFQIPLSLIGSPTSSIKICAFISGGGSFWVSNQFLAGLPLGTANLGDSAAGRDLTTFAGNQFFEVLAPVVVDTDGDGISNATDPDDDNDGLDDSVETNTGIFIDNTNTGTNPLLADTDGDGFSDKDEINGSSSLARVTSPFKKNYSTMMIAGNFLTPNWSDAPTVENTMTRISGQDYAYTINYNFRTVGSYFVKFLGSSWANNWGASATPGLAEPGTFNNNIPLSITATGFYTFTFNHDTLAFSFGRTVFANFAAYAAAYALSGDETADDDSDGLTNGAEFTANTDPTRANDATPPVITVTGNALVAVVLNGSYTDAGATATDNVDSSVTVNSAGLPIDTSLAGTYTVTYSASDAAGNAAATKTRTVVVYDPAAGFASRFTSVTVPGNYTSPGTWDVSGSNGNSMTLVGNFKWRLAYEFTSARSIAYKIVGGADWGSAYQWGAGGALGAGDATANVVAGLYYFELDEILNTGSLTWVGSTFAGWGGGAPLTTETLVAYAIGGASSPTATDGVKPNSTVNSGNLVLTAIVRTDNPKLTVVGEAVASLTDYANPASVTSVNGVDTADQTGVPSGCKRQTFTIPQGSDTKKFLRLKATLAP